MTLDTPDMVKAIGSNVAQYVTVKTFVQELRKAARWKSWSRNC